MSAQLKTPLPLALEPMELSDIEAVLQIEAQAYSHPWTRGNFEDSLNSGYTLQCAWRKRPGLLARQVLVGYFVCMPVFDEVHLLNLTVAPEFARQGLGRWLLGEVHAHAQRGAANALWLEVRPSNEAAIRLYSSYGFSIVGRRRDYYPAHEGKREDALLLKLLLGDEKAQT
jgi:[ribosomal protein S18]-alanine N-acetyltransferase